MEGGAPAPRERGAVALEEQARRVLPGAETVEERREDARHAVDDVERRRERVLLRLPRREIAAGAILDLSNSALPYSVRLPGVRRHRVASAGRTPG